MYIVANLPDGIDRFDGKKIANLGKCPKNPWSC